MASVAEKLNNSNNRAISLPQLGLAAGRNEILAYFQNSWQLTELLFSGLANDEAFYSAPAHKLRHPMIFYYTHPVVVYVNKLRVAGLLNEPVNAEFEALFEVGVDEMRWDDLHDGKQNIWPTLSAVRQYRQQAYDVICNLIKSHPLLDVPTTQESKMWALFMGFEHERIHLETSSVLMRELPIEMVKKPASWPEYFSTSSLVAAKNELISVPECEVSIGKPQNYPTYGWDNEYGFEQRNVRAFSASKFLITNAGFLQFVQDGGYANEEFWSQDGWKWKSFRNIKWPSFWVQNGPAGSHLFKLRTIFEVVDMEANLPVCVNFHEAKAYCNWLTKKQNSAMPYRLLTEAEHHAIRCEEAQLYNNQLASGSESPVNYFAANSKGFYDIFGNVWSWCEDNFHPLTGAKPHPYYDDFSVPCYDGQHQMILGGSFISSGGEASEFARFHFRPHFFQHAGFRVARSEDGNPECDAKKIVQSSNLFNAWGQFGWLATDKYYRHWSEILTKDLRSYLSERHVVDVGAGNGKLWDLAFQSGLKLRHLTMIDPYLCAKANLIEKSNVSAIKLPLSQVGIPNDADVLLFKQSFHLAVKTKIDIKALKQAKSIKKIIVLFMAPETNWPLSKTTKSKLQISCSNPSKIMEQCGRKQIHKTSFSFPVKISRQEWQSMVSNRFSTFLHDLTPAEISDELEWISKNVPDFVEFDDILQCWIFE